MNAGELGLISPFSESGPKNLITDVPGVKVGHCTIHHGNSHTGLTVIVPVSEEGPTVYEEKLIAACHVQNGFGKSAGLIQIEELGTLETPIVLTNTLNVGKISDALIGHMIDLEQKHGIAVRSINPVVGECNDSSINEISDRVLGREELEAAFSSASSDFAQGAVGAGTGTICFGFKGGIGSASRIVRVGKEIYTFGLIVQSNFGRMDCLTVNGRAAGKTIAKQLKQDALPDRGSIMMILATDCPLTSRQLKRILRRVPNGLARLGGYTGHGSGEVVIGFSTAARLRDEAQQITVYPDRFLDPVFLAATELCEEAVLNSMLYAEGCMALNQTEIHSLSEFLEFLIRK